MINEACTTIIVGSKMMADGSRVYARSDDSCAYKGAKLVYYPATDNGPEEFVALDSPFRCKLPAKRFGFSALERADLPYHWGEGGFNDLGVGMSATETIFSSEEVLKVDPYVESGLGENCVYDIVLPYIESAREGVKRLGSLIEKHGSAEGFGIAFIDEKEIWYLENAGGHRYLACKMPEDKYFVSGNQSRYRKYDPKDKRNYIASKDLIEFAIENKFYDPKKDGEFDFHKAYSLESENDKTYNYTRVWGLQKFFTPSVKTNVKVNDFPVYQVADEPITIASLREAYRFHYNGTKHDPYLNNNPKEPYRPVSIFRVINAHILQHRPWLPKEIGCTVHVVMGFPDLTPFLPIYQGVKSYPKEFGNLHKYSEECSAYWIFRKVACLGMLNFNKYAPIIKERYAALEAENDQRQKEMEADYLKIYETQPMKAQDLLQDFSDKMLRRSLAVAKDLQEELFTLLTNDIEAEYKFHGA